jgi:hypothetical protein
MSEKAIQSDIQLALGSRPDVRVFRNNVGTAFQGEAISSKDRVLILKDFRMIRFGLCPGSADLIGWRSIVITPEMVGHRVAVFASIENKTPFGRARDEQHNWCDQVQAAGGIAGFARSVEQATNIIETTP